jgi:hypothetical protein
MNVRLSWAASLCLLLSACAGFRAVEARNPVDVGDNVTVDPQVAWANAFGPGISGTVWTIDGLGLNELRFFTGIAPGAPLLSIPGVDKRDLTAYDATMLPNDVMELVATTLGKMGGQQVATTGLRPASFGSVTGFRFDLALATMDGLQIKGEALFAQRRGKLDVVLFIAPAEYYYDRYAPVVEKVFASVRIPDPPMAAKPAG